ncbi:MAG TPA: 3-hydroxyacyl-CoA dehydrogenase family protein, partial [Acidobacteriota bacterium]|nr:3-hydroxyacyl-CoA dehydrogenase family protein [Acidobacteriota bacterium]
PPPLLRRMVMAGHFGRKSGKGFYDYSSAEPRPLANLAANGREKGERRKEKGEGRGEKGEG